jgi:hypothetical protein
MKSLILFLACFAGALQFTQAQGNIPLLERSITVQFTDEPISHALKIIAEKGGFAFSYSPSIIDATRKVTGSFTNKTVRQVLDEIFSGKIEYKQKTKHIILSRAKSSANTNDQVLKGYIIDEATGERIRDVTVYEPVTLNSAITNSYGYFEIKLSKLPQDLKLVVNKESYTDTLITVQSKRNRLLNIPIRVNKEKIATRTDSLRQRIKRFWKTQIINPKNKNVENVTDTLYRHFQFSFIPYVGTNHRLSANVVNDYSFNLIGGHSLGVKKAELGGVFNLERSDVECAQVAGVFNTLGGKMKGVQLAGVFNANYRGTKGAQFAGIANINWDTSKYFSAAGVINFTRVRSEGVHLAGTGNLTFGEQHGAHIAGLFNFSTHDAKSAQVAGLFNSSIGNFHGFQLAGIANFTRKKLTGAQIGLVNYATNVQGAQLGLLNVTDSINGIPIGLLSIVVKGYHKIEISADEIFHANLFFRTGVRKFYNILNVGIKPETLDEQRTYWAFGYGIGTAPKLKEWLFLNFDLTANQIVDQPKIEVINLLNKLYLGFDVQTAKHFSITFGATLNGYLTKKNYENYKPLFTGYHPNIVNEKTFGNNHLQMWWGGKVGLRFL